MDNQQNARHRPDPRGAGWSRTPNPETDAMILLSRLNGSELGLNADLIERVESTPDTVITLIDGTKYVVSEPAREVVARIIDFRARVIASADEFVGHAEHDPVALHLVRENDIPTALNAVPDPAAGRQEH